MSARLAPSDFAAGGPHGVLALEPHLDLQDALEPSAEGRDVRSSARRPPPDLSTAQEGTPAPREGVPSTWRRLAILLVAIVAACSVLAGLAYPDILPATWRPHPVVEVSAGVSKARPAVPSTPAPVQSTSGAEPARDSHDAVAVVSSATGEGGRNLLVHLSTSDSASGASPVESPVNKEAMPPASNPSSQDESAPEGGLTLLPTTDEDAAQVIRRAEPRDDDSVQRAWDALTAGRPRAALMLYRQVLARQPDHIAAQLGEAAALSRAGLFDEATRRYRAVLERDPEHPVARANLLVLRAAAGETVLEQDVRDILSEQPSAALYALLGHLRARDGQWPAAREAFLAAHHLEADQADHLFNLGVSLEHLGQPDAALAAYRHAARTTGAPPASIDPAIIARRIAALSDARGN